MIKYIIIIIFCVYNVFILFKTYQYEKTLKMFGFNFLKYIIKPFFKFWYPFQIINKVNIDHGPIILCGNHIHIMDQCLAILSTKRPIHYMAKIEYFQSLKTKWFFTMAGCIPVDRSIHDSAAKSLALNVLNNNEALGIFPEGTRNKTTKLLQPFKFGAVSMAKKSDATLIPYAIIGKYEFRNKNLKIVFGQPFKVGDMSLEIANEKLYNEILSLIKNN